MQNYTLVQDIKVICVQAKSFPEGIVEAHTSLHSLIPPDNNRRYFAISQRNQEGQTIYSAAAEELNEGEAEKFGCETYIIQKGEYLSVRINEYEKDIPNIAKTFKELLSDPRLDPQGACVEMFLSETDILCMVKLKD
jgi:predicted transcriptional regulator YdeE